MKTAFTLLMMLALPVAATASVTPEDVVHDAIVACKPGQYYAIGATIANGHEYASVELWCAGELVDSCEVTGEPGDSCGVEGFYWGDVGGYACEGQPNHYCFRAYHTWKMLEAGPGFLPPL